MVRVAVSGVPSVIESVEEVMDLVDPMIQELEAKIEEFLAAARKENE